MKKIMSIIAALTIGFALTSCGETGESTTAETTTGAAETTTTTAATEETTTTTTTEVTTTTEATTTEATTTEEVVESSEVEEELYTVEECLRKIVEEEFGEKVEEIGYNSGNNCISVWLVRTETYPRYNYDVLSEELVEKYNSGEKVRLKDFTTDYSDYYGGSIDYMPVESEDTDLGITPMPDNPDGMYPMSECFRRVVENYSNSRVISIDSNPDVFHGSYIATVENGDKYLMALSSNDLYESDDLIRLDQLKNT